MSTETKISASSEPVAVLDPTTGKTWTAFPVAIGSGKDKDEILVVSPSGEPLTAGEAHAAVSLHLAAAA